MYQTFKMVASACVAIFVTSSVASAYFDNPDGYNNGNDLDQLAATVRWDSSTGSYYLQDGSLNTDMGLMGWNYLQSGYAVLPFEWNGLFTQPIVPPPGDFGFGDFAPWNHGTSILSELKAARLSIAGSAGSSANVAQAYKPDDVAYYSGQESEWAANSSLLGEAKMLRLQMSGSAIYAYDPVVLDDGTQRITAYQQLDAIRVHLFRIELILALGFSFVGGTVFWTKIRI